MAQGITSPVKRSKNRARGHWLGCHVDGLSTDRGASGVRPQTDLDMPVRLPHAGHDPGHPAVMAGGQHCALRRLVRGYPGYPDRHGPVPALDLGRSPRHPDFPSGRRRHGAVQDLRWIADLSRGRIVPDRQRASVFWLHVCLCRLLHGTYPAHFRHPLFRLSAAMGDRSAGSSCLRQFLQPPL